jgi:hypothetical protein
MTNQLFGIFLTLAASVFVLSIGRADASGDDINFVPNKNGNQVLTVNKKPITKLGSASGNPINNNKPLIIKSPSVKPTPKVTQQKKTAK